MGFKENKLNILHTPEILLKQTFNSIDSNLTRIFLPWAIHHPRYLMGSVRLIHSIKKNERKREKALAEGLTVPPFLVLSITPDCNLRCSGCFAAATGSKFLGTPDAREQAGPYLDGEQWRSIIEEASKLGVFGFVFAGGEPFLFPDLLNICNEFKDRFFIIITNGTTLTETDYKSLKSSVNIAVFVSIEGDMGLTNKRRGRGVHERAMGALEQLSKIGVPNGISVTVTSLNYNYWMDQQHLDGLVEQGVRLGLFIEYVPFGLNSCDASGHISEFDDWAIENENALILSEEERARFREAIRNYRATNPIYIINSPSDEEYLNGCVSAGKAFAHITPKGDLTPCPMSNIATHNLTTSSLREGLASPLFKEIRKHKNLHGIEGVTCALLANSEELEKIAKDVGAYTTNR